MIYCLCLKPVTGVNGTNVMKFYSFQTTHGNFNQWTSVWILVLNVLCAGLFMYYGMTKEASKLLKFDDGVEDSSIMSLDASQENPMSGTSGATASGTRGASRESNFAPKPSITRRRSSGRLSQVGAVRKSFVTLG